ncbi:hypothetical protein TNCV_3543881 [Trichonephila clavipes]|nr:hypothetical protein TNCV_3543881 [Trichonephila clavipes]
MLQRYLGLFLDAKLTFAYHIEQQTRRKALAVHAMLKKGLSPVKEQTLRSGTKFLLLQIQSSDRSCAHGSQIFGSAAACVILKKLHTLTTTHFWRQIGKCSLVRTPQ